LCGKAIGWTGWAGWRFKKSLIADRTLLCAGEKVPCGCDCWAALTLPQGLPAGNALIITHPQAHISATTTQLLRLVRVGIFPRHVSSVAPFPLAPSVEAYNRLANKLPETRTTNPPVCLRRGWSCWKCHRFP
jgi:hypothetical protein